MDEPRPKFVCLRVHRKHPFEFILRRVFDTLEEAKVFASEWRKAFPEGELELKIFQEINY